jgi:hypothetical protein
MSAFALAFFFAYGHKKNRCYAVFFLFPQIILLEFLLEFQPALQLQFLL